MFVEEPYGGHDGPAFSMPVRNVIPKPLQKPHPPIWGAATRKEKLSLMGERGIGALAFGLIEPERAREWVDLYYESLAADDSAAVGYAVNPNIAFATAFSCAEDEEEAIARGIDGAHFFSFSIHHWVFDSHRPGRTNMFEAFESTRDERGLARDAVLAEGKPLTTSVNEERPGARLLGSMQRSQRGGVGTPDQLRDFARRWEASGADQLMLIAQAGNTRHEHICESLELFGTKVLPEFIERDAKAEKEKAKRLEPVIQRLLSRAPADRDLPEVVVEPFNRYEVPKPA
jgi:alkanesulfonate monooxygenase SsuD/methylene tetrahydromethanopterin reductase-like flavin-dependent oxidoreductase (luciferase family)